MDFRANIAIKAFGKNFGWSWGPKGQGAYELVAVNAVVLTIGITVNVSVGTQAAA